MMKYKIIAKYLKNLKFNIPNTKTFFLLAENISNYKINIDIKSNQIKEKIIEVETCLELKAKNGDFEKITTQIIHATIIEIEDKQISKEVLEKIILIEIPKKIYDEVRESFVNLFEKCGFKDIKIDKKVDFENLYNQRKIQ